MRERLQDVRLRKDKPFNFHFGEKGNAQYGMVFAVLEKVYAAEGIERIKGRTLDNEAVHYATRGLQRKRLFHSSSYSVTLWRIQFKKYKNDIITFCFRRSMKLTECNILEVNRHRLSIVIATYAGIITEK